MIAALGTGAAVTVSSPGAAVEIAPAGPGVTIANVGRANPYPSDIVVNEGASTIVSAPRVILTDLSHTFTADLNIVLQAPDGRLVTLMAGCRAGNDVGGTLTFEDGADPLETAGGFVGSGTYGPSRCAQPKLDGAGATCGCNASLASLVGKDPNGTWSLLVNDDLAGDTGSLGSWALELTIDKAPVAADASFSTAEDTDLRDSLAGLASDPENADLDFALVTPPAHGTAFVSSDGTFEYAPDHGYVGVDTFTYRVDDDRFSDEGAVTITVTDVPLRHATCAGRTATIVGTAGPDVLSGTRGPDVIAAGGGRDSIIGGGGNDVICGGVGNDTVRGGMGDDTLDGGADRDVLRGGAGNDSVVGNVGGDVVAGGTGNDTLLGRAGNDTLVGLSGADELSGGQGIDHCFGGTGSDRADTCERLLAIP
jgi:Ca2+-binding RTX toxin-like protein